MVSGACVWATYSLYTVTLPALASITVTSVGGDPCGCGSPLQPPSTSVQAPSASIHVPTGASRWVFAMATSVGNLWLAHDLHDRCEDVPSASFGADQLTGVMSRTSIVPRHLRMAITLWCHRDKF